jgi:hypothetical protein
MALEMDPSKVLNAWDGSQVDSISYIPQGQCKLVVYSVKTPCTIPVASLFCFYTAKFCIFKPEK